MNVCDPDCPPHIFIVSMEHSHNDYWSILAVFTLYYDALAYCAMCEETSDDINMYHHVRAYLLNVPLTDTMLNLCTLMHDNSYHPYYLMEEQTRGLMPAGCISPPITNISGVTIPVVSRDYPDHESFDIHCTCKGCLEYQELQQG